MLHGTFVIIGGRTPERICRSKPRYRSRAEVRHKIRQIRSSGGPLFRWYPCDVCGGFHLTTRND